jgi:hypothetical protein
MNHGTTNATAFIFGVGQAVLGFELRAYTLGHSTGPFCVGFFEIGSQELIARGWL